MDIVLETSKRQTLPQTCLLVIEVGDGCRAESLTGGAPLIDWLAAGGVDRGWRFEASSPQSARSARPTNCRTAGWRRYIDPTSSASTHVGNDLGLHELLLSSCAMLFQVKCKAHHQSHHRSDVSNHRGIQPRHGPPLCSTSCALGHGVSSGVETTYCA